MKVDNSSSYNYSDNKSAQDRTEVQEQKELAQQDAQNKRREEEAAKVTGVGQHLNITA